MQQTIAQALAGQLAAWEVGTVLGGRDDILPLLDALRQREDSFSTTAS